MHINWGAAQRVEHRAPAKNESKNSTLIASKHSMVSTAAFQISAKGAEVYMLEISELYSMEESGELTKDSILAEYQDMQGAFSEETTNELPEHGISDKKIEFKDGQEPRNIGLRPMSPVELEEVR